MIYWYDNDAHGNFNEFYDRFAIVFTESGLIDGFNVTSFENNAFFVCKVQLYHSRSSSTGQTNFQQFREGKLWNTFKEYFKEFEIKLSDFM